jgi:hypothetical protein
MMKQRQWQKPVPPVEGFPPALRARIARTGYSLADKFRREEIFQCYRPKVAIALAEEHVRVAGETNTLYHVPDKLTAAGARVASSWWDAQLHTFRQHSELQRSMLGRAFDEQEIRDYAENYARLCAGMKNRELREEFARAHGIDPPEGRDITDAGVCGRLDSPKWWRRRLRAAWTRRAENAMRDLGLVRKGREPYASDDAVMQRRVQKARNREYMEGHEAVNETGEQLNLWELHGGSVSSPAIRRAEFMTRVRGFEEIADDAGHVGQFWTLTTPSAFHAQLASGGKNPKYNGATAREAQDWLCLQWSRARAKLKRLSILV